MGAVRRSPAVTSPESRGNPLWPLAALQQSLQIIYQIDLPLDVIEFVTTDEAWAQQATGHRWDGVEETVFVSNAGEELYISLFLDAAVLKRIDTAQREGNGHVGLHDYCLAVEGVSHFVFLAARALQSRQATAFEMELQAEIDKFVMLSDLNEYRDRRSARHAYQRLFDAGVFRSNMDQAIAQRYIDANRFAGRYCRFLQRIHMDTHASRQRLSEELRQFYRLSLPEKVSHIERKAIG